MRISDLVRVRVPIAPLNREPHAASELVSQALLGHPLCVIDGTGSWLHVRGADQYEGWIHQGYVSPAAEGGPDAATRISLGCTISDPAGRRRQLPLGALLPTDAWVTAGEAIARGELADRFPPLGSAIAASAVEYFEGTPYLWGGVTPWGADCSGFVQTIFGLHGTPLPRDARQQAAHGTDVRDLERTRAADVLFFSERLDGRITHVGIALGEGRLVHLGLGRGGYAIENLGDASDRYVAGLRRDFRFGRRVLP